MRAWLPGRGEMMILLINAIAIFASFSLNQIYAVYLGRCLCRAICDYRGATGVDRQVGYLRQAITKILADKWDNAEDLPVIS